ncbi:MAG: hypothetical protein PHO53_03770, partial [Actinomycetota bacterium]|nr:hypothetical protein [Actinomycetota bacterium]
MRNKPFSVTQSMLATKGDHAVKAQRDSRRLRVSTGVISVLALVALLVALAPVFVAQTSWGSTGRNGGIAEDSSQATWYLAEGSIAWGFDTHITIENPNDSKVTVRVTYMLTDGSTRQGEDLVLAPQSHTTIWPSVIWEDIEGAKDFSTKVECLEGKPIAVDRTMYWTGPEAASEEGHSSIGVTSPANTWYLPEGSSAWGFECWLLIQNPNDKEAVCNVTYM